MPRVLLVVVLWAWILGVIVVALALAAVYDGRTKRRGGYLRSAREMSREAVNAARDAEALSGSPGLAGHPGLADQSPGWMTWQRRDERPSSDQE